MRHVPCVKDYRTANGSLEGGHIPIPLPLPFRRVLRGIFMFIARSSAEPPKCRRILRGGRRLIAESPVSDSA